MEPADRKNFSQSLRDSHFLVGLFLQAVVAIFGSMFLGFLPEVFASRYYYNSAFEAYSPAILTTAVIFGYFVSRRFGHSPAPWVWTVLVWLAYGAYEESSYWYNSLAASRLAYIADHFFGPTRKCSSSECLGEFFFTTPFAATVGYSLGAAFGLRSYRKTQQTRPNLAST
jgi:hypothetical protein